MSRPDSSSWRQRLLVLGPLTGAIVFLGGRAIAGVLERVGHPGAALDDAYIHFQYARAIAEGHPLRFQAGAPITSGCTSMLWPILLSPFWALGARGEAIMWPAWALSFASLGALAWEAFHLTEPLAGRTAAVGASAMTLSFAGFTWGAASGMEVVPFAWAIARTSRLAAEWAEADRGGSVGDTRSVGRATELAILAWVSALLRPEGAVAAMFACATFAASPRTHSLRSRAISVAPAAGACVVPGLLWAVTGSPRSTTAIAKLLPGNPYYAGSSLVAAVIANARLLVGTLLNGDVWSAEFLPHGGAPFALAGLTAVVALGIRTRARWRAAAILLLALTMFAPCFYLTFLWNRLRYLWPFATGWIVGLACLARVMSDLLVTLGRRANIGTGMLCGVFAGLLGSKLGGALDDVAQSASGIDRQQVALGRWAKDHLATTVIGVNDTGAIAYFGERDTFDVVGLTTKGEAKYWVAGVGLRFEHYERMGHSGLAGLPTHFIVYPEWMGMTAVLGKPLFEAVVTDSTILGGQTMRVYVADWSTLGTGESPWSRSGEIVDALDVADLESEAAHDYDLLGARDGEEVVHEAESPSGTLVVDGGRTHRTRESFVAHLRAGAAAKGIVRLRGPAGTVVHVLANGDQVGSFALDDSDGEWVERPFEVPAEAAGPRSRVELRVESGSVSVFHYWFVAER